MGKKGVKLSKSVCDSIVIDSVYCNNKSELARQYNCSPATVDKIINDFKSNHLEEYKRLIELANQKLEEQMIRKSSRIMNTTLDKIEERVENDDNIPLNHLTMAYGVLYDKKALATGKATNNNEVIIHLDRKAQELAK